MAERTNWQERYEIGDIPWDTGRPDSSLTELVSRGTLRPGKLLELGCGTGSNAVWLSLRGFDVTATDLSPQALAQAEERAAALGAPCRFVRLDILAEDAPGAPFELAFDRGCFHTNRTPEEREHFARRVAEHLVPGGHWLSLCGSVDAPPREHGPPRLSALDIATAVEPHFELRELRATHLDSNQPDPHPAWFCWLRRRT